MKFHWGRPAIPTEFLSETGYGRIPRKTAMQDHVKEYATQSHHIIKKWYGVSYRGRWWFGFTKLHKSHTSQLQPVFTEEDR